MVQFTDKPKYCFWDTERERQKKREIGERETAGETAKNKTSRTRAFRENKRAQNR